MGFLGAPSKHAFQQQQQQGAPSCSGRGQAGGPHPGRRSLQAQALGNTFGTLFRVSTYGESHGKSVGCQVDGVPPRLPITQEEIQRELDRRRPGQSRITTPRKESDTCSIHSGVADGLTLGTPIHILVPNTDQKSQDYSEMAVAYRPSHADATYDMKYGIRAVAGGGRSSARETIGRVAAGAIAKKLLAVVGGVEVLAYVSKVWNIEASNIDPLGFTQADVEANDVRCPDPEAAKAMYAAIDAVRKKGDSCGGVVTVVVRNCPVGLGSPVFGKLEAELSRALMSLPASKAVEVGSGFAGAAMLGSEHNDEFFMSEGEVRTRTNRSGGIQGGLANGMPIVLRVAFKPTSTIARKQRTVSREGLDVDLTARGRHDPCVVPRAVPMCEAMAALVLADQLMQHFAQCELLPRSGACSPDVRVGTQFAQKAPPPLQPQPPPQAEEPAGAAASNGSPVSAAVL